MKKLILLFIYSLLLCVGIYAQDVTKIVEIKNTPCDEYLAEMDNTMIVSNYNPTAKIYVLVYEGREREYNYIKKGYEVLYPIKGSAEAKIESIKKYHSVRKFSGDNFVFIKAGFRENSSAEFWLVPEGAKPPEPEPAVKEFKYRKGRAVGFCTYCC